MNWQINSCHVVISACFNQFIDGFKQKFYSPNCHELQKCQRCACQIWKGNWLYYELMNDIILLLDLLGQP